MGTIDTTSATIVIRQAYNVETCIWDENNSWFEITLTGINYVWSDYVTLVTAGGNHDAGYNSYDGNLVVHLWMTNGSPVFAGAFSFMVLDCP
jgi:hypothetical protein